MIEKNLNTKKTLVDNPEYFGSYMNMARHNIFIINNHLSKKFGIGDLKDEQQIGSCFFTEENCKKLNNIYSLLKRFMPIVRVFDDESLPKLEREALNNNFKGKDLKDMTNHLKIIFNEINSFRNDYTHYYSLENGVDRKIEVSIELKKFLEQNFLRAIAYSKDRFKEVYTDKDFELASNTILFQDENKISKDGLVFLIAIFLDRENAFAFFNKIIGFKGTQNNSFKAKREVFTAYCVRLPNEKFVSEDTEQAFSLELINEISKCPKVLYNVITETAQQQFKPVLDEEAKQNILEVSVPETIDDYEAYIESISKRVRNKNRFSYFALKFLDTQNIFKKMRFQIDLGKLILDEYQKTLNGNNEDRRVVENVKAFRKLQDIKNETEILANINRSNKELFFEQFAPHYNFDANKIGISFKESIAEFIYKENATNKVKASLKQPTVDAVLSINELPKIILLEYLDKGKTESLISDF